MPILFPTSPTLGQVFTEGGRSWVWSGATWDSPTATNTLLAPYGLELIRTAAFSGAVSHSFGSDADPIFTSKYDNYKILLTSVIAASSSPSLNFRVRANTTDLSSSQYSRAQFLVDGSSITPARTSPGTSMIIAELSSVSGQVSSAIIEIQSPALSSRTNVATNNLYYAAAGASIYQAFGIVATADPYNGFTIFTSGPNISGTMSVYGYKK